MPKKDAAKLDKLQHKIARLQEEAESDEEADQEALYDQIEAVQEQIETIERKQTGTFHPTPKPIAAPSSPSPITENRTSSMA